MPLPGPVPLHIYMISFPCVFILSGLQGHGSEHPVPVPSSGRQARHFIRRIGFTDATRAEDEIGSCRYGDPGLTELNQ